MNSFGKPFFIHRCACSLVDAPIFSMVLVCCLPLFSLSFFKSRCITITIAAKVRLNDDASPPSPLPIPQVEPPGEHEFSRRYVACVLAVSSSAAGPLQQLQQLASRQHQLQHGQPGGGARWFSNNVLIYHLVVTDSGVTPEER